MTQTYSTAWMLIDVQEKLFPKITHRRVLEAVWTRYIRAFQILQLPALWTEQVPSALGQTIEPLSSLLRPSIPPLVKNHFSCWQDPSIRDRMRQMKVDRWVLMGIETHICVALSAWDLQKEGMDVAVLADAVGARDSHAHQTALDEMRAGGIRVAQGESLLFEMMGSSAHADFSSISALIKPLLPRGDE